MVQGAMELIADDNFGSSSVALLKNKKLPAGSFFVELIYIAEASAPKSLQIGRFLPPTPIRILLDKAGNNLAANVGFDGFNQQLSAVGRQTASKLANALQPQIHGLIQTAATMAEQEMLTIKAGAHQSMSAAMADEVERLTSLKKCNPNIRDEEIQFLAKQQAELDQHIEKTQLKLDAIRLIVVSH